MEKNTGEFPGTAVFLLIFGVQGVLFAAFLVYSMMNLINYQWLLLILIISIFFIAAGVYVKRGHKLDSLNKIWESPFFKFMFWIVFGAVIFLIVAYISISIDKPFDLLDFLSFKAKYSRVAIPLLLVSVLIGEGLLFVYFSYFFYKFEPESQSGQEVHKGLIVSKVVIFISLSLFLSRNLWPPALGDLYRAVREISLYVLISGFLVLILQRLTFPLSFAKAKKGLGDILKSSWLKLAIVFLGIFGVVILFISMTGMGITYDPKFWNAAGVPILFEMVLVLVAGIILFPDIHKSAFFGINLNNNFKTIIIGLLVWLGAVLLWNGIELPHTYFAPKPQLPNTATFPFSDASYFDIGSQYILIGRGVNNSMITDRPMLMLLFSLFHFLGGQDYIDVIFVQICFLALIPAFIFLLGKTMHSPQFGVSLAFLVIFKEAVALRTASTLSITNVKVLMSELPAALYLILFTYFLYKWFDTQNDAVYALSAGGVLGITLMVRANVFPILFSVGLFSILFYAPQKRWGAWLRTNLIFVAAVILVLLPYSLQTYRATGTPFILKKIYDVIDRSYSFTDTSQIGGVEGSGAVNFKLMPSLADERTNAVPDIVFQVGNYYFRNIIMTFLAYPTIPGAAPISTLEDQPYWNPTEDWQTKLTWYQWGMIAINLSILAFGMSAVFNAKRWNGFTPLMVFLTYHVANAAARTAGGRYLVPADWALHFYYVFGLFSISAFFGAGKIPSKAVSTNETNTRPDIPNKNVKWKYIFVFVLLSVIGSLPILVDLIPDRLADLSDQEAVDFLIEVDDPSFEKAGYSVSEIQQFVNQDGGEVISGLSLYPRFYNPGESDAVSAYVPDMPDETQRVYFILLGKNSQFHVNLLQQGNKYKGFPHAEQVMVIGCNQKEYFDAFLVFNLENQVLITVRSPSQDLTCNQ